jgi:hypothetical protein
MADIMNSEEHRTLFHKQAECEAADDEEKPEEDDASADTCECSDNCPCKSGGECNECAVKAKLSGLITNILKMSEDMDELGWSKSASDIIGVADRLVAEAAGADTIEELVEENPDLDVDLAVIKEKPKPDVDTRALEVELEEEGEPESIKPDEPLSDPEDIVAQLEAIEEAGPDEPLIEARKEPGLEEPGWLEEEPDPGEPERGTGLADLAEALAAVEAWLKKHGAEEDSDEIKVDASLSSLLTTAEKEVEDYLIDKNMNV